ncbi:MAG: FAD-dependent oxidoreductase, partial [Candidatus Heimdallarchaeota archaeon]
MPDNPPTNQIELKILGMTCDSCAVHVQRALESVPEVAEVHVPGWSEGRVTVIVQQPIDDRRLLTAVKDVGYRAEVLKAEKSEELKESSTAFISLPSDEESSYDLVVIGTGGAGMAAAIKGAELGHRVCIIEQGTLGGTCVNIGCIPSKTLIWAASVYHKVNHPPFEGLHFQAPKVDWTTLVHEKEQLVAELRQSKYQDVLAIFRDNITVVRGRARLRADASVQLENGHLFHASKIVIATGARPKVLPVNGVNKTNILTSTSALALKTQPKSLVIIGGRAIALELGQMFARFGTKVTILQRSPRLLPAHDPELAEALATYLQVEGLTIHTNSVPVSIHEENNIKILKANIAGQTREFQTEEVLMAVGRAPNTQDIGLKEAG